MNSVEFAYTLITWVAIVMALTFLGLFIAYKRKAAKKVQEIATDTKNALQRIALYDAGNQSELMNTFIAHESHNTTRVNTFSQVNWVHPMVLEAFLIKLDQTFESVELVSAKGDGENECSIYRIKNGDDGIGYVRLDTNHFNLYHDDDKLKPLYSSSTLQLDHYCYDTNGVMKIPMATSLQLIIPIENNDSKIFAIEDECITYCTTEYIGNNYRDVENTTISRMTKLDFDQNGNLIFRESDIQAKSTFIGGAEADLMYSDVKIKYNGKEYARRPSVMLKVLHQAAKELQNIMIFGNYGTGKTRIMHSLAAKLSQSSNNTVIYITPAVLTELNSIRNQSQFMRLLRNRIEYNPDTKFYLVIDEAETALRADGGFHTHENAFLLQFMDGVEKQIFNIATIMTFNADPKDLNQALFRSNRAGVIVNMEPITKERAEALVEYLKTQNPEKVFLPAALAAYVNEDSKNPDGVVYAPAGYTTISDVTACFVSKKFDAIMHMLDETEPPKPAVETPMTVEKAEKSTEKFTSRPVPVKVTVAPKPVANVPTQAKFRTSGKRGKR